MEGYPVTVGRYEILRPLAEGGFGQVYLARMAGAAGFHRTVAIKRIRYEYTSSADFVEDFIKEARIGGYLQHHNVVQVLGFDQIGGHYLLIMEFVDGVGLDRIVDMARQAGQYLPPALVAEVVAQAADGLHYIHALRGPEGLPLQLIHRDLKPSNLLIGRTGMVKITDFGIARAAIEGGRRTQVGMIKGTIAYLSPEQARGEPLDHRSDLYSLGSILYELLALERLFSEEQPFVLLGKLGNNEVDGPLERLPAHAAPFLPLLRRLLTEHASDRIGSAAEVAETLRGLQRELAVPGVSLPLYAERWADEVEAHRSSSSEITQPYQASQDPMIAWTMCGRVEPTVEAPRDGETRSGDSWSGMAGTLADSAQSAGGSSGGTRAGSSGETRTRPVSGESARTGVGARGSSSDGARAGARGSNGETLIVSAAREAAPVAPSGRPGGVVMFLGVSALLVIAVLAFKLSHRESEEVIPSSPVASVKSAALPAVSGVQLEPSSGLSGSPGAHTGNPGGAGSPSGLVPGGAASAGMSQGAGGANGLQAGAGGVNGGQTGAGGVNGGQTGTGGANGLQAGAGGVNGGAAGLERNHGGKVAAAGMERTAGGAAATNAGGEPAHSTSGRNGAASNEASPSGKKAEAGKGEAAPQGGSSVDQQRVKAEPAQAAPAAQEAGRLIITSRPSALAYVEGKSVGETPIRGIDYAPGSYTIRLSRPDLQFQQSVQVQVKAGATVRVMCLPESCDVTYP